MRYSLALSAEDAVESLAAEFSSVGMIRGEYIFRLLKKYITTAEAQTGLKEYLEQTCKIFHPKPVWYRISELDVKEVSVLEGSDDDNIDDGQPYIGTRGIRRAQLHPETFKLELNVIKEVSEEYSNLGIILPFVTTYEEVKWAIDLIRGEGINTPIGSMAEIPAFILDIEKILELDLKRIVVGLNDLSSLTMGADRRSKRYPNFPAAMIRLLKITKDAASNAGVELAVAGNHSKQSLKIIEELGIEECVIHYSQLPELLGSSYDSLPRLDLVKEIKHWTQAAIKERAK